MSQASGEGASPVGGVGTSGGVWLLVHARAQVCALPIEQLVETMRPLPTPPFPGAPPFVLGVARIRGAAVPVVDLGGLLGSAQPSLPTRFLTLRLDRRRVAVAVEGVLGLRHLSPTVLAGLPPLLASTDQEAVAAIGTLDSELLLCLETTRIVPESLWSLLERGGPP